MIFRKELLAVVAFIASFGFATQALGDEIIDLVRQLTLAQYRMVVGDMNGRHSVEKKMEQIERLLPSLSAKELQSDRAAWAVAVYLLSGGNAEPVRALVRNGLFVQKHLALIEPSLAFAEGSAADMTGSLSSLDARSFPPSVAGHLFLVQGSLLMKTDSGAARRNLRFARLLMPDSLVEEAALRRELLTLDPTQENDDIEKVGLKYATKYSKSPFAPRFWDGMREAIFASALVREYARTSRLEEILGSLPAESRVDLHMNVSRRAILSARVDVAREEIRKAKLLTQPGAEMLRIAFHEQLLDAITNAKEVDASIYLNKKESGLSTADRQLGHFIIAILRQIELARRAQEDLLLQARSSEGPTTGDGGVNSGISEAIQTALRDSDELLSRTMQR